jgi:putative membrane protein
MKYMARMMVFHMFAIWFTAMLVSSLHISGGLWGYILSAFILTLLNLIIAPMLKILFLPITLLTFGILSFLLHTVILYMLTLLSPTISITPWTFDGFAWSGFIIPAIRFSYAATLIITSLLLTWMTQLLHYLSE